ncbi:MAG: sugar phosphate nucleotidyltransferase, partial [Planctomycetia bacterium]
YKFDPFSKGFVEVLAAQQTNEGQDWYQGTADAVRQQIRYVLEDQCKEVMILSGDQLYRMDFRELHRFHRDSQADVTIATLPVDAQSVSGFGVVQVDESSKVLSFTEKPKTLEEVES